MNWHRAGIVAEPGVISAIGVSLIHNAPEETIDFSGSRAQSANPPKFLGTMLRRSS